MWISAGRDENFRIREQTLTSSRGIAGAVTYHAVNESNPPLAMQMDPTTLQLIQVLERTVSSGECPSRAVGSRRGDVTEAGPLSRPCGRPPGILVDRKSRRSCSGDDGCDGGGGGGSGGDGDGDPDPDLEHAREMSRSDRVRVAVLGVPANACSDRAAAASADLLRRRSRRRCPADGTASHLARCYARYRAPSCCC